MCYFGLSSGETLLMVKRLDVLDVSLTLTKLNTLQTLLLNVHTQSKFMYRYSLCMYSKPTS